MQLLIPSLIITLVSTFLGVLIGIYFGRVAAGLADEWDGWPAQIDFLLLLITRGK